METAVFLQWWSYISNSTINFNEAHIIDLYLVIEILQPSDRGVTSDTPHHFYACLHDKICNMRGFTLLLRWMPTAKGIAVVNQFLLLLRFSYRKHPRLGEGTGCRRTDVIAAETHWFGHRCGSTTRDENVTSYLSQEVLVRARSYIYI